MENKPVAWVTTLEKPKDGFITAYAVNDDPFNIPLYTAPKELSDEEINTIREALLMIGFQDAFINYHLKEEALAILKKASEK